VPVEPAPAAEPPAEPVAPPTVPTPTPTVPTPPPVEPTPTPIVPTPTPIIQPTPQQPPVYQAAPAWQPAPQQAPTWQAPPPAPKKKINKLVIILPSVFVFLVICAVAALLLISADRSKRFENAKVQMEVGNYQAALSGFQALGNYEDAPYLAAECQKGIDYDAAKALFDGKNYAEAKIAFERLAGYKDASFLAAECQNAMDYDAALALKNAQDYAGAHAAFVKLGSYKDASDQAMACKQVLDYAQAQELMDKGDYKGAAALLEPLSKANYENSRQLFEECSNITGYEAAEEALASGENYTAFKFFRNLGEYRDAAQRADKCVIVQKTGEIYRNSAYKKSISVQFRQPKDGFATYWRIYSGDTLVAAAYANPGDRVSISLPVGVYSLQVACGTRWFGETDMFGDEGDYYRLTISNDTMSDANGDLKIKSGYRYWIERP